jgi:hypothetical protein
MNELKQGEQGARRDGASITAAELRVQRLMTQMRLQQRFEQAMATWQQNRGAEQRGFGQSAIAVPKPASGNPGPDSASASTPRPAPSALHHLLGQAVAWLRTNRHHPDALAVAMEIRRIAPRWPKRKASNQPQQ